MRIDPTECHRLLVDVRVARLATADHSGRPHIVPITFALVESTLITAIDHKPKTTARLRRIRNIAENPSVAVLADHYDDDWSQLWWVRADGTAHVRDQVQPGAIAWLANKYPQYTHSPPDGPFIEITVDTLTGWKHA